MTEMRSKVCNIVTKFVVLKKNKFKDKSKNLYVYSSSEYWVTETYKMIENHVHIRSTDHFKQVGVRGKMTD